MDFIVRAADLSDVPAVVALERRTSSSAHWTLEQYNILVASGVVLLAESLEVDDPPTAADHAGQPRRTLRGFLCARVGGGEWEIENVAVSADFLRRGVARELVRALLQRAAAAGAAAIFLEVRESNLPARRLYEASGFRESGRRRVYYQRPPEDAILYSLQISGGIFLNR